MTGLSIDHGVVPDLHVDERVLIRTLSKILVKGFPSDGVKLGVLPGKIYPC